MPGLRDPRRLTDLARVRAGLGVLALASIPLLGWLDLRDGPSLRLTLVYVIPVMAGAGVGSRWLGVLAALASAAMDAMVTARLGLGDEPSRMAADLLHLSIFVGCALMMSEVTRQRAQLRELATTDHATLLLNRTGFEAAALVELRRAVRYDHPIAVLFLDIDDFKVINDRCGHATGDRVLRHVAGVIASSVRMYDIVGRLGGDEFAVLLPETNAHGAWAVADKINRELSCSEPPTGLPSGTPSVSIGAAGGPAPRQPGTAGLQELLALADRAMYERKRPTRRLREAQESQPPAAPVGPLQAGPPAGSP